MPKFQVEIRRTVTSQSHEFRVSADTQDEADKKARQLAKNFDYDTTFQEIEYEITWSDELEGEEENDDAK